MCVYPTLHLKVFGNRLDLTPSPIKVLPLITVEKKTIYGMGGYKCWYGKVNAILINQPLLITMGA